jgi:hypothetical protein
MTRMDPSVLAERTAAIERHLQRVQDSWIASHD